MPLDDDADCSAQPDSSCPPVVFVHAYTVGCHDHRLNIASLRRRADHLRALPLVVKDVLLFNPYGGGNMAVNTTTKLQPRIRVGVLQQHVINHVHQVDYTTVGMTDAFKNQLRQAYKRDPGFARYARGRGKKVEWDGIFSMETKDRVWRIRVPNNDVIKTDVIAMFHDSPTAAHPGVRRTQLAVSQ
ncbi:Aste57867_23844 [Aphanomyces stellatus]|uniref:Aste57867_23844 protein n=1 Tax=Aphanomyces stellatus TaxID=120398 RepID=A0A485LPK2_9STRA|nr:hypothetical protein As57867_023771 [Aphanomyces stellatus]VFU00487.1 Aste57867_23844 [Aphanomyces stellatus]